jgi:fluoride exporter
MNPSGFLAVGIGAALGAWLRWGLSLAFNSLHQAVPPGTLAANVIGGYLIGLLVAFFAANTSIAPEWRLFAITGFLGGLTTFSTFSAEAVALIQQARYGAMLVHIALHLVGSIVATLAGFATYRAMQA